MPAKVDRGSIFVTFAIFVVFLVEHFMHSANICYNVKFLCYIFANLGAEDVISFISDADDRFTEEQHILFKELSIRKEYNVVFFTTATEYNREFIRSFVAPGGLVIDTVEPPLASDSFGEISKLFYGVSFNTIITFSIEFYILFCFWLRFTFVSGK